MSRVSKLLKAGLFLAAVLGLPASRGEADPPGLHPQEIATEVTWGSRQVLQATRKGDVLLLRPDTLEVYPVRPDGTLGQSAPLADGAITRAELERAAMSQSGSRWLLVTTKEALLFENGKAERLPGPGWRTTAAAFLGEEPATGAFPMMINVAPGTKRPRAIPLVLHFTGREWAMHIEGEWPSRTGGVGPADSLFANHTTQLIPDKRHLWVVWPHRYVLKRFSPAGKEMEEIVVGEGEAKYREDGERAQAQLGASLQKSGYQIAGGFEALTAKRLVLGGTMGRDGRLYLLASPAGGNALVLDRYDSVTGTLERAAISLPDREEYQLAAGKDALYFAAPAGTGGRWKLAWEVLEHASWVPVDGVKINGAEVETAQEGQ